MDIEKFQEVKSNEPIYVGWPRRDINGDGSKYTTIRISHYDLEISESFAQRIEQADMGDVVRGRTEHGMLTVKVNSRLA